MCHVSAGEGADDIERLKLALFNEKLAPALLPHNDDLVIRIKELTNEQSNMIAELEATAEPTSMLQRSLYEMELERVNYMLRSYMRTRLIKISRFSIYLDTSDETRAVLSENELDFLKRYLQMYRQHVDREIWDTAEGSSRLDERLRDINLTGPLVVQPELDSHVYCKALVDCEPFRIEETDETIEMLQNEIRLLPFRLVERFVHEDKVMLV
jgi:GINS complex subunit 4|tara:strand:- start:214 stop:849 length:636 start_codon:yes stop_codon:yes gene_type:complete